MKSGVSLVMPMPTVKFTVRHAHAQAEVHRGGGLRGGARFTRRAGVVHQLQLAAPGDRLLERQVGGDVVRQRIREAEAEAQRRPGAHLDQRAVAALLVQVLGRCAPVEVDRAEQRHRVDDLRRVGAQRQLRIAGAGAQALALDGLERAAAGGQAQAGGGGEGGQVAAEREGLEAHAQRHVAQRVGEASKALRLRVAAHQRQRDVGGEVVGQAIVGRHGVGDGVAARVGEREVVDLARVVEADVDGLLADVGVGEVVGGGDLALADQRVALVGGRERLLQQLGLVDVALLLGQRLARGFGAGAGHGGRRGCRGGVCGRGGGLRENGGSEQREAGRGDQSGGHGSHCLRRLKMPSPACTARCRASIRSRLGSTASERTRSVSITPSSWSVSARRARVSGLSFGG